METKLSKLKSILRSSEFSKGLTAYLNKIISQKLFADAKEANCSIADYLSYIEDDSTQHTVVLSAQLSYQGVKSFLVFHANKFFESKGFPNIKVLGKPEYQEHPGFSEIAGKAFDVVFEIDGELCALEIKLTQSDKGFTGATHSTSKVNDYFLIYLDVDRDKIVRDGENFINSIFMAITTVEDGSWSGTAKSNSSWTSFKFLAHNSEGKKIDYSDDIVCGSLKESRVWCSIQGEQVV